MFFLASVRILSKIWHWAPFFPLCILLELLSAVHQVCLDSIRYTSLYSMRICTLGLTIMSNKTRRFQRSLCWRPELCEVDPRSLPLNVVFLFMICTEALHFYIPPSKGMLVMTVNIEPKVQFYYFIWPLFNQESTTEIKNLFSKGDLAKTGSSINKNTYLQTESTNGDKNWKEIKIKHRDSHFRREI